MKDKAVQARSSWLLAAVALLMFMLAPAVFGQTETGQISGTVTDPAGAVIPGATVKAKGVDTGFTRTAETGNSGTFVLDNLRPGVYDVSVESKGFSTAQARVTVTVGARVGRDFKMEVGQINTVVEVSEAAVQVNTVTQTLGSNITTAEILELPNLSRNPYNLVGTVGNVSGTDPSGRGTGYAINGQRSAGTGILLDGTANNDEFTATPGQSVPLDSIQEFSVLTNNFTAEFGRASAGVVNVVTKSGTNLYHGSAYEFGRYSKLASNDFNSNANGLPKSVFTRNQFGYSIGGPIKKDKLFFFNNTEWLRVRSSAFRDVLVPTPQLLAASAANTQSFFTQYGTLRSSLVNLGTYTKSYLASAGITLCATTGSCANLPGSTPIFNHVAYSYPSNSGGGDPQNTYFLFGRVDYNLSDKTQLYVRYSLQDESDFAGTVSDSPYQGYDSPNLQKNHSFLFSLNHSFSPTLLSQTKIDFNRFKNTQPFGAGTPGPTLYLASATVASGILGSLVAMPGYDPYTPGNSIPFGGPQNFVQIYQDFSKTKGSHNIKFGFSFNYLRDNRTFGAYQTAVEYVGRNLTTGMDNFLNGQLYQFQAAVNPQGKFPCLSTASPTADCTLTLPVGSPNFSRSNRYREWGLYAEDSFKVSKRLTLNYGLRWEIYGTQHNKNSALDSNFYLGSGSTIFSQIAAGNVLTVPNSPDGELWHREMGNFGPRLGIAFDVFGDGKTSLRGGYARSFERNFGNVTFNIIQNPPNYAVIALTAGTDLPTIPISNSNAGPLAGNTGTKALPAVSLRAVDPHIKTAYVDSFSGALEHRLAENIVVAIEGSYAHGANQYGIANINLIGSGNVYGGKACTPGTEGDPGTCTARLASTRYSSINYRTNGGTTDYAAGNLRLDWRGKYGLSMRANYTYSHALDMLSDTFSSNGTQYNLGWLDAFHPEYDRGSSDYDVRHRFVIAGMWQIPMHSSNKIAKQALGGWAISPTFIAASGSPYSLYNGYSGYNQYLYAQFTGPVPSHTDTALTPVAGTPNTYHYFDYKNVAAPWYNPKYGTSDFGPFPSNMIGRNFFSGPGSWNLDLSIHKSFALTERYKLQFRMESSNFLNHPYLNIDGGAADVSASDYMSAYYAGRRYIQLGLRLDF